VIPDGSAAQWRPEVMLIGRPVPEDITAILGTYQYIEHHLFVNL
jgi:hypothetical protein